MNGEVPSVPITTLAGVSSLSDLLPEMPLPTPLPHTLNNKSLLFHPKIAEDAKRILSSNDPNLVSQLVSALRKTNTDHIELNDGSSTDHLEGDLPELLKAIVAQDATVFKGGPVYHNAESAPGGVPPNQQPQQPSPYQAGQSPCTPGSPARVPPQSYQGHSNGGPKFQQSFMNFAHQSHPDPPTVNGGSPSMQHLMGNSSKGKGKSSSAHKPSAAAATVTSDAMPPPMDETSQQSMASDATGTSENKNLRIARSKCGLFKVPLIERTNFYVHRGKANINDTDKENMTKEVEEGMKLKTPTISLTRIEESLKKDRKKSYYNVISATGSGSATKLKLKISKIPSQEDGKGVKRNIIDLDSDDDYTPSSNLIQAKRTGTPIKDMEIHEEFSVSLSDRVAKRRRRTVKYDESDSDNDEEVSSSKRRKRRKNSDDDEFVVKEDVVEKKNKRDERAPSPIDCTHQGTVFPEVQKKKKEMEKKRQKARMDIEIAGMSVEDLMDTPTFKRFNNAIEAVLDAAEDIDLTELNMDDDEGADTSSEAIISKSVLSDLSNEAAKLKTMGIMNKVPTEKLVKVLTILQYNIKDGCKVIAAHNDETDDDHLYREIALEKVLGAVDAGLTALHIMTAADMPKEVYIEDVIDRLVLMTKLQLTNSIFPEFDPVYRLDNNKSGYVGNIKQKRAHAKGVKNRSTLMLYNKLTEVTAALSELVDIQELTDTIILQLSTLSVSPFFVENISELQLNSLKLVSSVFTKYEKHRQLIMEDILSSLARLPSSKKNLRSYRLNADENIQMVTALALQLIQCVVHLPPPDEDPAARGPGGPGGDDETRRKNAAADMVDKEVILVTSYETAMRTAHNFLAVFLRKCSAKGDEDYRPLFENFVYDLLSTVNKPEWPAAELLLSLLGRLLVQQFTNKQIDMSLRVASLDYLGIVAARLRKDAVSSKLDEDVVDDIIHHINESDTEECKEEEGNEENKEKEKKKKKKKKPSDCDRAQNLQKALLEYLVYNAQNDPALMFSRQFYIGQWYRDCSMEVEKAAKKLESTPTPKMPKEKKPEKNKRRSRRAKVESESEEEEEEEEEMDDKAREENEKLLEEIEKTKEVQQKAEVRKSHLMEQINSKVGLFANFKPSPSKLDYEKACLVTRYLASSRPFSQSFDIYLTQILKVLCETAVAVRTRAMKCLTAVVEADPAILARADMQAGVHGRFHDQSTSVREAAVELVGKFILVRPELTAQYYDMLSTRILDTGISVRKRVIKIFRDICIEQTEFEKIPEMCVKMIRRVNDEEGIKKLVNDTFQNMWFTPLKDSGDAAERKLLTKVMNITDVVASCKDTGFEWFEQLLENLLKKEEEANVKPVMKACVQLVKCLVENVLRLELSTAGSTPRMVACFTTLHLFCKVKPELLVPHTITIQPYLDIKCSNPSDLLVLHNVARILEQAVPLMEHPSENFLAQLEEDMTKLILKHGMRVVQSCVSCLGAIVNTVTHNYKLVKDCFQKFFAVLTNWSQQHQRDPASATLRQNRPTLLRALFTVGLLCRHFDFDSDAFGEKKVTVKDKVFDLMMYFVFHEEEKVQSTALLGVGFLVTHHYEFMMGQQLRDLYHKYLTGADVGVEMRVQVLHNLQMYLGEEENRMLKAEEAWRKKHNKEDLKEMGDIQSGMASTIIQVYLKQLLESFFHPQCRVRLAALNVIVLVLRQGLVHPVQIVPYLICMGSDCDKAIRSIADQQLAEIDKKYPGFIQMKASQGVKMSFRLQEVLHTSASAPSTAIRGFRLDAHGSSVALNSFIYSLIRSNRGQRRAIVSSALNMFDDSARTPLQELLYMADNLAYFPYQLQDEALFIIHQIDINLSVSGSNLIQSFRELLNGKTNSCQAFYPGSTDEETGRSKLDEDEDEEPDTLFEKLPADVSELQQLYIATQGCVLLLLVKQHLKDSYGFTEAKIQRYSPTDQAKVWDKPLTRKGNTTFSPQQVIDVIGKLPLSPDLDEAGRRQLVDDYLEFKQLMLSIDPDEEEDEDDMPKPKASAALDTSTASDKNNQGEAGAAEGEAAVMNGDAREEKEEKQLQELPKVSSSLRHFNKSSHSSSSSRRHGSSRSSHHRSSSSHRSSSHRSSSHKSSSSSSKKKKKRKKQNYSDSDEEESEDSDSDPDWS